VKTKALLSGFGKEQNSTCDNYSSSLQSTYKNSITPFLLVFNLLPAAVKTTFSQMDWNCIARTPYSKVEQSTQEASVSTPGQQRQFLFADYGNTSGLNQSRADDPSGMSRPVILNGTSNHTRILFK
jgi:hypothetical protein